MMNKPKATSMLIPAIVALAIFFAGMGYMIWNAKAEKDRKRLEAMGMENFTATQLEVSKGCDAISAQLGRLYDKIEEFSGPGKRPDLFQQAMPKECLYLHSLRLKTHAERVKAGGN